MKNEVNKGEQILGVIITMIGCMYWMVMIFANHPNSIIIIIHLLGSIFLIVLGLYIIDAGI